MRLNAKYRDFWARGQKWYHFWADTDEVDSEGDLVETGTLTIRLIFSGRTERMSGGRRLTDLWRPKKPIIEVGTLEVSLFFSEVAAILDNSIAEEDEAFLEELLTIF